MIIRPICQTARFKSYIPKAKEIPYFLLTCFMTDILDLIVVMSVAIERNIHAAKDSREQQLKPCSERGLMKQKVYCSEFYGNEYRCDQSFILW